MRINKTFLARLLGVDEPEITSITGRSFTLDKAPDGLNNFKSLIHARWRKRAEALAAMLSKDDDLGKVVRAHIYVEHELYDFIFFAAPCPEQLARFEKMEYSEKLRIALVLGLNVELKVPLSAVGTLRNNFAHRLDMKIGEEEAKNLIKTLSPERKQKYEVVWQGMLAGTPEASLLPPEGRSYFKAQMQVMVFFLQLFDMVAEERHRIAFEKLQSMAWH